MPPVDVAELLQQDLANAANKNVPYRFAFNHLTDITPATHGFTLDTEEGRLWALRIKSPGALSLNLGFEKLSLAPGARLFVYTIDKTQVLGAFTKEFVNSDYPFATEILDGDDIIVELYEPHSVAGQSFFKIFRVSHGYRPLPGIQKGFGDAGSCMVNVNCPEGIPYQDIKKSVICLVSGGSEFCTAALVNNTAQDGTPYVLTANHCVGGSSVNNWVFRFNWEAPGCPNPTSSPGSNSLTGAQLVASNAGTDFALLKITANNAANFIQSFGAVYAGWDRSNSPAPSAIGIHHPSGDIKKISLTSTPNSAATYNGAQCWQTGLWTTGVTEPGSSGSPLFNPQKRIVGQLYGGPSSCSAPNNQKYDFYGRFDVSWNGPTPSTRLRDWLDPGNTGVMTLDLFDPNALPLTHDAAIQSVLNPVGSYCGIPSINPQVLLRNNGSQTLTSCQIQYKLNNNGWQTFNWVGALNQGQSITVTLPTLGGITYGTHTFSARTQFPNGLTDQNPSNDSTSISFVVINNTPVGMPLNEGFEGSSFPPSGWTVVNSENFAWNVANVGGFGNSAKSAAINNYTTSSDLTGNIDDLILPFVPGNGSTFLQLKFDVAYARYSAAYADTLKVLVSTDCGNSFNVVYQKFGSDLATAPDQTSAFTPTPNQWRTETLDLSAFAGHPSLMIVFRNVSGWGNWLYIDNVNITQQAPQPPIPSFTISDNEICQDGQITYTNTSQNTVSVSWTFQGGTPAASQSMGSVTVSYNTPGQFTTTLTAMSPDGSTASVSQQVSVVANPLPVITQNGNTLSVVGSFNTYQWYFNGSPIVGATGPTCTIQGNGNYMLEATNSYGCKGYSNIISVQNWSQDNVEPSYLRIYPNPAQSFLFLQHQVENVQRIEVMDCTGRIVLSAMLTQEPLDISRLPRGPYLVKLEGQDNSLYARFIKY